MDKTEIYVIDIEGFIDNGDNLIPKEIAIVSLFYGYADHWILELPYWHNTLNRHAQAINKYMTKTGHGLEWEIGDVPYSWLFQRIAKVTQNAERVYVHGGDIAKFLIDFVACEVINITRMAPPIKLLPGQHAFCLQHGIILQGSRCCALNHAMRIREFLMKHVQPIHDNLQTLTPIKEESSSITDSIETLIAPEVQEEKFLSKIRKLEKEIAPELTAPVKPPRKKKTGSNKLLGMFVALLTFGIAGRAEALIGYDCGSSRLNITTLSLLDVEHCDIPKVEPNVTSKYIQLLQISEFTKTAVIQCKISIRRTVYHCGMHSHNSVVAQGTMDYIHDIGFEACRHLHVNGILRLSPYSVFLGIKANATTTRSVTLAGTIKNDGACSGSHYSDPYGTWDDVIVQGEVRVTLQDYFATVNLNTNQVSLRSGISCPLSDTECVDVEGGHTYWNELPDDKCRFSQYEVLYEGLSNRLSSTIDGRAQIVYAVTRGEITFALTRKQELHVCGHILYRTEHPKLFIFESMRGAMQNAHRKVSSESLDMFTYINAKFVYLEKHIRSELNTLYYDILKQNCNLERQILKGTLTLATQAPDEFAYQLMKGPGHMAVVAGEVAHIIKCIPVEVRVRHTQYCYHHLPVARGNESLYISPRTHILFQAGTQISCNPMVPAMYQLQGSWYKLTPAPVESPAPPQIKPLTKPTWKYSNPGNLAISGIYTQADLDNMRDHIMFPAERTAILNTIARGITGHPTQHQGTSLLHLLDEEALEKISRSAWERIWGSFMTFGTASAGVLGIILIIRGVKLIADTIIHGYALHSIYGWSLHLFGAIWSSVTHLLIHLGKNQEKEANNETQADDKSRPLSEATSTTPLYPTLDHSHRLTFEGPTVHYASPKQSTN